MTATPHLTPEGFRTAAYLEARARLDAPLSFTRTGKTKGRIKCVPPNKPCGNRCIPANWNCRITGGGLDSHSKAVEFDPVAGTGNIIRGTKNVIEGYKKKDPEKITRGIKGIERGIVKITPGDSAEQKQRVRKRVKTIGTVAFLGVTSALALHATHRGLKRGFQGYRTGLGAEIDRAAAAGVERVLETWDAGVDRIGLGRLFGTGTAQIRGAGQAAASRLGRQGAFTNTVEARLGIPARTSNYLQTRARLRGTTSGIASINAIDAEAVRNNWSRDEWEARKIQALYGLRENGRSVFAAPATHEMLAAQWGFQLPPRSVRESGRFSETSMVRYRLLPEAVRSLHEDLTADLKRRRFTLTPEGITEYTNALLRDNPTLVPRVGSPTQQRALEQEFRLRMREVLTATTSVQQRSVANNAYSRALNFYDDYFTRAAEALTVNENGRLRLSRTADDSPFGDAMVGLSRLHAGQNTSANAHNRDSALFLNGYYFHNRVRRNNTPYPIRDARRAIQYASGLSGQSFSSVDEAVNWFRNNGYNVRVPTPRGRRDAADLKQGKPCGESFIPKNHKCGKTNKVRTAAKIALAAGATAGTIYALKKAKLGEFRTGIATGDFNGPVRKRRFGFETKNAVSHTASDFADVVEGIKGKAGVDDANVQAFQNFVKANNIHSNPATVFDDIEKGLDAHSSRLTGAEREAALKQIKFMAHVGLMDGFAAPVSDNIYVRSARAKVNTKMNANPDSVLNSVNSFMDHKINYKMPDTMPDKITEDMKRLMIISHNTVDGDVFETINMIHEVSHKVHFKASSNAGLTPDMMMSGNLYQPPKRRGVSDTILEAELRRAASLYGQTDADGRRAETFAELSVLYVTQGKRFRKEYPLAYDWVDQIWNKANA